MPDGDKTRLGPQCRWIRETVLEKPRAVVLGSLSQSSVEEWEEMS